MMNMNMLSRLFALIFLFLVGLAAACVLGIEIITGQPINTYAFGVVSTGISYSLVMLGIHLGNGNQTGASTS